MANVSPLRFYLIPMPPTVVGTATVASTPADPYMSVAFNSASVTGTMYPLPGNTIHFETGAGLSDRGALRLRSFPTGSATGNLSVAESDDVGPLIQSGDSIRITNEFRLWPIYPRFTQAGTVVTQFEDYDIPYTDQLNQYIPTAVAGPPAVVWLDGGTVTVSFVGDRSFANAPSATLSSYLWTAYNSSEGTSTSLGTEGSPVTFTYTTAGRHLVSFRVTDSNGKTHTAYTYTIVLDPAAESSTAFLDFDAYNERFDYGQGGGECSFQVRGDVSPTQFPNEMMVIHAARGTITTPTASWPNRDNVLFVGWVMADTVRQDPERGDVSFRAGTIDRVMRNLAQFPVSLSNRDAPTEWTQAKTLNVDRTLHYVYNYRSTLANMTPIIPSSFSGLIGRQDFGPQDLFSQVQGGLMKSILGNVTSSPQSVLYHVINYNLQNTTERASATSRKTIHKGLWVDDVGIEEIQDYSWQAQRVKMSGVPYSGGDFADICPLFSEAPGDAPKVYGKEVSFDRLILIDQDDLNVRCGHALAMINKRYQAIRMSFINDGSFANVPQDLFPVVIEAGDNDRQIALSGRTMIARSVSRDYDHRLGYFKTDVTFELTTTGTPGVTVDMPCLPPEQEASTADPVTYKRGIPLTPPIDEFTAVAAGTTGTSYYFAGGMPAPWQKRVKGLAAAQQAMLDINSDPFSWQKAGGYNPESIIMWGVGHGFAVRSTDSGKNWQNRTGNLPAPSYPGDGAFALSGVDLMEIVFNEFVPENIYILAGWQNGGNWRAGVLRTQDGFTWSWTYLDDNTQVRPLGMAIDRGNSLRLWVTTWESDDTLNVYRFELPIMSESGKYSLGSATSAEVEARTYWAHPSTRFSAIDEVFVHGRMNAPQSLANPEHVIRSIDAGVSWTSIENGWGADLAAAFKVDENNYYYGVRKKAGGGAWQTGAGAGDGPDTTNSRLKFMTTDGVDYFYYSGLSGLNPAIIRYNPRTNSREDIITFATAPGSGHAVLGWAYFNGTVYILYYNTSSLLVTIAKWNTPTVDSLTTVYTNSDPLTGSGPHASSRLYVTSNGVLAATIISPTITKTSIVVYSSNGTSWNNGSFDTNPIGPSTANNHAGYFPTYVYDRLNDQAGTNNAIYRFDDVTGQFNVYKSSLSGTYKDSTPSAVNIHWSRTNNRQYYNLTFSTGPTTLNANIYSAYTVNTADHWGFDPVSSGTLWYKLGAGPAWSFEFFAPIGETALDTEYAWFAELDDGTRAIALYRTDNDTHFWHYQSASTELYQGLNTLTLKIGLPFDDVSPNGLTLNKSQGRLVIGSKPGTAAPIIYLNPPYTSYTAANEGIAGTHSIQALRYI